MTRTRNPLKVLHSLAGCDRVAALESELMYTQMPSSLMRTASLLGLERLLLAFDERDQSAAWTSASQYQLSLGSQMLWP